MNIFEKIESKRTAIRKGILPTWTLFRAAITELVNSYNQIEEGQHHPAKIDGAEDTFVTVSCDLGKHADKFHTLTVSLKSAVVESGYKITCSIEKWIAAPNQAPQKEATDELDFVLDADPEGRTWLVYSETNQERRLTAFQAAELALSRALLDPQTTAALNIAVW